MFLDVPLDLDAQSQVAWAGPDPVPVWFDVARDFTEHWVHQQQIRDAVDRPGLTDERYLRPVLRTFAWALPHHYRRVGAPLGTTLGVAITGTGGGDWTLTRTRSGWELDERRIDAPDARVAVGSDHAWRLFTGALDDDRAIDAVGDPELTGPFRSTRAIIV